MRSKPVTDVFIHTPMPPVVTVMTFIYCLEPVTAALAFQASEGNKNGLCIENIFMAMAACLKLFGLNGDHDEW